MAVLLAVYFLWPGLRTEAWGLFGLSGVVAIVAGSAVVISGSRALTNLRPLAGSPTCS